MHENRFWQLIESGGESVLDDQEQQLEAIRDELIKLPASEVMDFQRIFNEMLISAYTWNLWQAAFWITGGCLDEDFIYFRAWLISRGQSIYENAVLDPDSLADVIDMDRGDYEFPDLWALPMQVYRELTDEEMPPVETDGPDDPRGERIDLEDKNEFARALPHLAMLLLNVRN